MKSPLCLIAAFVFFCVGPIYAQCVDFDGDGRPDACGSAGSVPEPSAPSRVDTDSHSRSTTSSSSPRTASTHTVHHSSTPSTESMVAGTVAGAVFGTIFSDLFSPPPQPQPSGPTPEEIAAQKRLEEQKRLEFQRSNLQLKGKLKGGTTYVEDKNVSEAGGLKLKAISVPGTQAAPQATASASSSEVHSNFFGSSNVNPKVELLREPMTGAGTDGSGLLDPAAYKQAVSRTDLTQEERERLFLRTKVKPVQLDDHPMIDARALVEKERWTDPYLDVAAAAAKGGARIVSVGLIEEGGKRLLRAKSGTFKDAGYDEAVAGGKAAFVERPGNTAEAVIAAGDYVISKKVPTWQYIAADGTINAIGAGTRQAIVRYWAAKDSRQYYDPTPVATAKEKWNNWVSERNDCSRALLNRIGAGEFKE